MHILETYALTCGLKIDKPYVFEHYTSVPFPKFISFYKRAYPYYQEVIDFIKPELDKHGINILQLKATQQTIEADVAVFDNLSFGQWAYLIKHSLLHFGEDDFLCDLAAHYDIPRVILFSNTFPNTTKPYWGSVEKEKVLFSTGKDPKPTLSGDPNVNKVRTIKPEQIAQAIMDLLGIPWKAPYETIFIGNLYRPQHDIIEIVPEGQNNIDIQGRVSSFGVRMDYKFDEQFLANVVSRNRAAIVTNQPINLRMLEMFRQNVIELAYFVDTNGDVEFSKNLARLNLPYALMAYESDIALKEKFFEVGIINQLVTVDLSTVPELKDGLKGLYYKSAKRVLTKDKEYKGKFDWLVNQPTKPQELSRCPEEINLDFLRELDFFYLVKPLA